MLNKNCWHNNNSNLQLVRETMFVQLRECSIALGSLAHRLLANEFEHCIHEIGWSRILAFFQLCDHTTLQRIQIPENLIPSAKAEYRLTQPIHLPAGSIVNFQTRQLVQIQLGRHIFLHCRIEALRHLLLVVDDTLWAIFGNEQCNHIAISVAYKIEYFRGHVDDESFKRGFFWIQAWFNCIAKSGETFDGSWTSAAVSGRIENNCLNHRKDN